MSKKLTSSKKERKLAVLNPANISSRTADDKAFFNMHVVGQEDGIDAAIRASRRSRSLLKNPDRPIMVIYELGPSRSGKTLVAETLALRLHGNKKAFVKINGGNYKQRHEVARLIGAPPGYLGHKEGDKVLKSDGKADTHAKLTQKNLDESRMGSDCPTIVVLIDEANLMHPDFDDILMSVFDKGELDMGNNLVTDFRNVIFILTSNLGMDEVARKARRGMGFNAQETVITPELIESTVKEALADRYRPEWLNRIDRYVIFKPHTEDGLKMIVDVELEELRQRMERTLPRGKMFQLEVEDSAKTFLLASTLANKNNLTFLKRAIDDELVDGLDNLLEQGAIDGGDIIVVRHIEGEKSLTFLKDEENSFSTDADDLDGVIDTEDSQEWLASSRRLARAAREKTAPNTYEIAVACSTERQMIRAAGETMKELKEIYGIDVLRHSYARSKPWTLILTVSATTVQIEEFAKVNPYKVELVKSAS